MKKILLAITLLTISFVGMSQDYIIPGIDTLTGMQGYPYKFKPTYLGAGLTNPTDSSIAQRDTITSFGPNITNDSLILKLTTRRFAAISGSAGGGVTTMAFVGSSSNNSGASISGNTLTLQPASNGYPGVVTIGTQTFAGAKTFSVAPAIATLTTGSVLFAGASGLISQNNSNLFWDNPVGRLGIGTNVPLAPLSLGPTGGLKWYLYQGTGAGLNSGAGFATNEFQTFAPNSTLMTWINGGDYTSSNTGLIRMKLDSLGTLTSTGKMVNTGVVANGTVQANLFYRYFNGLGKIYEYYDAGTSGTNYGIAILAGEIQEYLPNTGLRTWVKGGDNQVTGSANELMRLTATGLSVGTTANTSWLQTKSFATSIINKTSSYTATISDYTITISATGQTITLPTAAGIAGRMYVIKLTVTGSATVATTLSQTIDGSTTYSLSAIYKYVTVQSDGINWQVIANN